ncbi:hypothetical protein QCA50_006755 [Cerrena zonata]|uniref:DUF6535 domain-containing protein n=1 Tax=Cerrena zonata TaxID=2478898 RepID=A0AAW0GEV1_9APHY
MDSPSELINPWKSEDGEYPYILQDVNADVWDKFVDVLLSFDHTKIDGQNKAIDALLILTGLLSAIIGAFALESYRNLQPDPATQTVHSLEQLVLQANGVVLNQAGPQTTSPSFQLTVFVNVLWFLSLLFTIITASLGVFVKQWLQRYLNWQCTSSQERLRVRHVRHRGLLRFRVLQLAELLPILLQLALMLFLAGLVLFLLPVNVTVGWAVLTGVICWCIILLLIFITPFLSHDCPYHLSLIRSCISEPLKAWMVRTRYGPDWTKYYEDHNNQYYRFPGDERGIRREARADASLMDNNILRNVIVPCVKTLSLKCALDFARKMLSHRLDREVESLYEVPLEELKRLPTAVSDALLAIVCRYLQDGDLLQELLKCKKPVEPLHCALEMIFALYNAAACVSKGRFQLTAVLWGDVWGVLHIPSITELTLKDYSGDAIPASQLRHALTTLMLLVDDIEPQSVKVQPAKATFNLLDTAASRLLNTDQANKIRLTRAVFKYMLSCLATIAWFEPHEWEPHVSHFSAQWLSQGLDRSLETFGDEYDGLKNSLDIAGHLNETVGCAFIPEGLINAMNRAVVLAHSVDGIIKTNTRSEPNTACDNHSVEGTRTSGFNSKTVVEEQDTTSLSPELPKTNLRLSPSKLQRLSLSRSQSPAHSGSYTKSRPSVLRSYRHNDSDPALADTYSASVPDVSPPSTQTTFSPDRNLRDEEVRGKSLKRKYLDP